MGNARYETQAVTDYGADEFGSAIADTAIQAAIDAAELQGSGTVYFPDGNFLLSAGLTVEPSAGETITLTGPGKLVLDSDSTATAMVTAGGSGRVIVDGLSFAGGATGTDFGAATATSGVVVTGSGVRLSDLHIDAMPGSGVVVGSAAASPENVLVKDCLVENCKRFGLSVLAGKHLKFKHNDILETIGVGIAVHPEQDVEDIALIGNTVRSSNETAWTASTATNYLLPGSFYGRALDLAVIADTSETQTISGARVEGNTFEHFHDTPVETDSDTLKIQLVFVCAQSKNGSDYYADKAFTGDVLFAGNTVRTNILGKAYAPASDDFRTQGERQGIVTVWGDTRWTSYNNIVECARDTNSNSKTRFGLYAGMYFAGDVACHANYGGTTPNIGPPAYLKDITVKDTVRGAMRYGIVLGGVQNPVLDCTIEITEFDDSGTILTGNSCVLLMGGEGYSSDGVIGAKISGLFRGGYSSVSMRNATGTTLRDCVFQPAPYLAAVVADSIDAAAGAPVTLEPSSAYGVVATGLTIENCTWRQGHKVYHSTETEWYKCKVSHVSASATQPETGGSWPDYWVAASWQPEATMPGESAVYSGVERWESGHAYQAEISDASHVSHGTIVTYDGNKWMCVVSHTAATATNRPGTGSEYWKYWVPCNWSTESSGAWANEAEYTASHYACIADHIGIEDEAAGENEPGTDGAAAVWAAADSDYPFTPLPWRPGQRYYSDGVCPVQAVSPASGAVMLGVDVRNCGNSGLPAPYVRREKAV